MSEVTEAVPFDDAVGVTLVLVFAHRQGWNDSDNDQQSKQKQKGRGKGKKKRTNGKKQQANGDEGVGAAGGGGTDSIKAELDALFRRAHSNLADHRPTPALLELGRKALRAESPTAKAVRNHRRGFSGPTVLDDDGSCVPW